MTDFEFCSEAISMLAGFFLLGLRFAAAGIWEGTELGFGAHFFGRCWKKVSYCVLLDSYNLIVAITIKCTKCNLVFAKVWFWVFVLGLTAQTGFLRSFMGIDLCLRQSRILLQNSLLEFGKKWYEAKPELLLELLKSFWRSAEYTKAHELLVVVWSQPQAVPLSELQPRPELPGLSRRMICSTEHLLFWVCVGCSARVSVPLGTPQPGHLLEQVLVEMSPGFAMAMSICSLLDLLPIS